MAFPRPIPISTDPLLPPPPLPFFSLFRNRYYFFSFINIFNMDGRYPSQMSQMGAGSGSGDRGERRRAAPPWHSPAPSPSPPTPSFPPPPFHSFPYLGIAIISFRLLIYSTWMVDIHPRCRRWGRAAEAATEESGGAQPRHGIPPPHPHLHRPPPSPPPPSILFPI